MEAFQGVAPVATVIAVKVFGADGSGTISDAIAGIEHCVSPTLPNGPADVVNLSCGGGQFVGPCDGGTLPPAANAAVDPGLSRAPPRGADT